MAQGDIISAQIERSGAAPDYPNLDGWVLSFVIKDWVSKTVDSIDLGWSVPNDSLGNDPDNDAPAITVNLTRPGFTESGGVVSATTRSRTLYGTKRIRQAWPTNTLFLTEISGDDLRVYVGLSGYVYSGDTAITVNIAAGAVTATDASTSNAVSGLAVTNQSAVPYPKVKATILNRASSLPFTRQTGNYVNAVHGACKGGILGLLCTLSDESSNSVNEFVAEPSVLGDERSGSANAIKGHGWVTNTDITGLDQGELMTARFRMYPIDGDAGSVYDSADFTARDYLRNRTHRIDHTGAWPTVYAYVDEANGDNGTGIASETASSARALPFSNLWGAVLAIRNYNNANFGRSNSLDGGVVRLKDNAGSDQDFVWGRTGFAGTMTAPGAALIIEPDPPSPSLSLLGDEEDSAVFRSYSLR